MADGSSDTTDILVEERGTTRVFVFQEFVLRHLPVRFICHDDECSMLDANTCSIGTLVVIDNDRVPALRDYCKRERNGNGPQS